MESIPLRLAYFPVGKIHFDTDRAQQLSTQLRSKLISRGFKIDGGENVLWDRNDVKQAVAGIKNDDVDIILVFHATFTDSTLVLEIARNYNAPLVLWSVPEDWDGGRLKLNSFTGMHLAAHALLKNHIPYFYVYTDMDDHEAFEEINSIARASHVVNNLKSSKIGVIGDPPAGFETSDFDGKQIKFSFGITIEQVPLQDFFSRIVSIPQSRIKVSKNELEKKLINLETLEPSAVNKTIAVYESLLDIHEEIDFQGFAVRCWPEFFEKMGCSACGAISMATENGIACSCEADVFGTVTQLILQSLSGGPAIGTDIVGFDLEDNSVALWHCGLAPISMANPNYPVEATTHSNRGLPLLMQFPFKPGRITLARLTQTDNQIKLIVGQGEMLDRPRPFTGTCGVLRFENPASQVLDKIMSIGMEHHISFTYGDYRAELEVIANLLGLAVIYL